MTATVETGRRDAVVEQLFQATIGALELLHVYVGDRLGLYTALSEASETTPADLAARAGIAERYAREWLEEQAVAGFVDVTADDEDPGARRYRLPDEVAEVMTDPDSLNYLVPLAPLFASIGQSLPAVLEAFRSGGGVPYAAYGEDLRGGIARLNRPMFLHQLAADWIPALPDIEARLTTSPAHVADLGCGAGWSSIAIARAYPAVHVDGIDLDEASVAEARHNAEAAGVADRVSFGYRDAGSPDLAGRYDLVTFFETVHDMADPVAALRAGRALLAPGGAVLVGDEKVAESFTAPGDDLERFNYGWSALHCLPAALTEADSAGTGTVMRPDTLRSYADDAGFATTTVLPIEHDFWRFYRLDP
ncbi:class I SAM-dependent methyltransferase [Kribbella catacumbae]|uniref:class I SAM-dependent methyltransferase n=1 Tax=Kribbella catacumbae TaxID=460086 RepID=UPI000365506C|nr:class I SAM-dependent methyltransferase [Kribbella catacumbae]